MAFVAIHIITLILDTNMNFSLADLFIPFHVAYKPIWVGMGILGFYFFVLIILTSLVWVVTKYSAWRFIHYLAFPTFLALFLHGIYTGTDTSTLAMTLVYWITGMMVAIGLTYRLMMVPK